MPARQKKNRSLIFHYVTLKPVSLLAIMEIMFIRNFRPKLNPTVTFTG